jgi:hypothetical protein
MQVNACITITLFNRHWAEFGIGLWFADLCSKLETVKAWPRPMMVVAGFCDGSGGIQAVLEVTLALLLWK